MNSSRDDIVRAASRCLEEHGVDGTTISAIAREAGTSRQTVHKHVGTREEAVAAAVEYAAAEAGRRIARAISGSPHAAAYVVELCLASLQEFRRNPAISPLVTVLGGELARASGLSREALATARPFLAPVLDLTGAEGVDLDELTETFVRFELSLLTLESDTTRDPRALRRYLERVLVPALRLAPPQRH